MKKALLGLLIVAPLFAQHDMDEHNKWMRESAMTIRELTNAGDKGIPEHALRRAQCVGVIPNLKRAGFIVGAKYGKGVLTCRTGDGKWSAPAIMRIEGGSIGVQIGVGETDVVLLVMNESGENKLTRDKFTVGGDASVMAGPVGRSAQAETDAMLSAEILAYSRSRGLFGGVSLEGATLRPDNDDDAKIYGHPVTVHEILHGQVTPPPAASDLYAELNRFPHEGH
jgi:lipid-binding SYLF domain-containing protein